MDRNEEYAKKILDLSREELSSAYPFITPAIYGVNLKAVRDAGFKYAINNDGDYLYDPEGLIEDFMGGLDTAAFFLHSLLHCLFLHPFLKPDHGDREKWDISIDLFIRDVMCRMGRNVPADRYHVDEHIFWQDPEKKDSLDKPSESLKKWGRILREVELSLIRTGNKTGGRGDNKGYFLEVLENIERRHVDFGAFLKRFGSFEEMMRLDPDSFDYPLYSYGLELYGDMPLIEPLEYSERRMVREFAVAIDTSLSCEAELIRQFLERTYDILFMSMETGEQKKMIIFQCDREIKDEAVISNRYELKSYMKRVSVQGRGGTDFRPVFNRIEELRKKDRFSGLKGLLYFTDGDGVYPEKPPKYKTAFVLPYGSAFSKVPPWAVKVGLNI